MFLTKKLLDQPYADITDRGLGIKNALYVYNPGQCILPPIYDKYAQDILDATVRVDDVWLVSYPRTGSTWCQEMIWLIGNNLDFETASTSLQQIRAPLIEMSVALHEFADHFKNLFTSSVDYVNSLPTTRYIKSHLPFQLLPKQIHQIKPKIIYTMRHPKDLCVSYFYHCKLLHGFNIDFDTFCELFLNNSLAYGGVFNHYLPFWSRRNEANILVLRYEDMKKDTKNTIRKIASFLDKSLTEEDVVAIDNFLSFSKMRNNKACNAEVLLDAKNGKDYFERMGYHFIRKGQVGDWKNHMSEEMSKKFDEWIEMNTDGTDLSF